MLEQFTNQYAVSKTLRFELKPVGKTKNLIRKVKDKQDFNSPLAPLILEDEKREKAYKHTKQYMDNLHRTFLAFALDRKNITEDQNNDLLVGTKGKEDSLTDFWDVYKKDKKDKKLNTIQKKLADTLLKVLDSNAPNFLETLAEQKQYIQTLKNKDAQKLEYLKENRKNIAEQIKNADKKDEQKLKELRKERDKSDKEIDKIERAIKEYDKALNFKFEKSGNLYDKTENTFTLLRLFYATDKEKTKTIAEFDSFHGYFTGFNENRKNVYSTEQEKDEFKSTSIAHRLLEQNLKFHCDNILKWETLQKTITDDKNTKILQEKNWNWKDQLKTIEENLGFDSKEFFSIDSFTKFFSQNGIDEYNKVLGGLPAKENQAKKQGINELINLTRQQVQGGRKEFAPLQELYKQILSERDKNFIDVYTSNQNMIEEINNWTTEEDELLEKINNEDTEQGHLSFIQLLHENHQDPIYLSKENLRFFSQNLTGNWNAIETWFLDGFDKKTKQTQAKRKTISLQELEESFTEKREQANDDEYGNKEKINFYQQYILTVDRKYRPWLEKVEENNILKSFFQAKSEYLTKQLQGKKTVYQNQKEKLNAKDDALTPDEKKIVKNYLDASLDVFRFFRSLTVRDKDLKDGKQNDQWKETLNRCIHGNIVTNIYNKTRNFLTKKDFSTSKFKLNFENSTLADGWDVNKEKDNTAVLLRKCGQYFLAIMGKEHNTLFENSSDEKYNKSLAEKQKEVETQEQNLITKKESSKDYPKELDKLKNLKAELSDLKLIKSDGEQYEKVNYKFFKDGTTMIPKCSTQVKKVKDHFKNSDEVFYLKEDSTKNKFYPEKFGLKITKEVFELNNLVYDENKNDFVQRKTDDKRPKKFQKGYLAAQEKRIINNITNDINSTLSQELSNQEKDKQIKEKLKSQEIQDRINKEMIPHQQEYKDALKTWISFCKAFLESYPGTYDTGYDYKNLFKKEHKSLDEFYSELSGCIYKISFTNISESYIDKMIDEEKLYLFQIYSKDFSIVDPNKRIEGYKQKKGTDNLQTMYWKALFEEKNLRNVVAKLNGQAELFYRKASLNYSKEKRNEGHHAKYLKDKFNYTIIKDKRYSEDKILFHCPITLNFQATGQPYINNQVNEFLQNNKDINIIGIDRGERNLLYYSVINQKEEILDQGSLNIIKNEYEKDGKKVNKEIDYHAKLDAKEKERAGARENWETIENIKELKAGYLSQVVHSLCKLIIQHNAIVVLEDLNVGFKRVRFGIAEKQIYQKFERAVIEKLNYLVNKKETDINKAGHYLKAFQLANQFKSFTELGKQSGILFYTTAGYTSKTDPITGYMRSLYPKYQDSKKGKNDAATKAQEFFAKFDSIIFNGKYFEFSYNLKNLKGMTGSYEDKKELDENQLDKLWTIHSHIQRSKYNQQKKVHELEDTNDELIQLFKKENIILTENLDVNAIICDKTKIEQYENSKFLAKLMVHFNRLLDMRVTDSSKAEKQEIKDEQGKVIRTHYIHNAKSDFIVSPIYPFYDSRKLKDSRLPQDSDANGAYNIARKGIIILENINNASIDKKGNLEFEKAISKTDWQHFAQDEERVEKQIAKWNKVK